MRVNETSAVLGWKVSPGGVNISGQHCHEGYRCWVRVRAWECSRVWRVRQLLHPHSLTPWKWEDRPAPPNASVPIYRWDNRLTAEFTVSSSLLTGGSGARRRHKPSWVTALNVLRLWREVLPTTRMSADPPRPAPSLIRPSCWCLFPSHIHAK